MRSENRTVEYRRQGGARYIRLKRRVGMGVGGGGAGGGGGRAFDIAILCVYHIDKS